MRRGLFAVPALVLVVVGCGRLEQETRVERGPQLRTFDREVKAGEGRVRADVEAAFPVLTVSIERHVECRKEKVEEYLQREVTETVAPAAAPAIGAGLSNTVIGGALLLLRPLFSNTPDTTAIDGAGRYPAPARQTATTVAVVFLATGIPSLIAGGIELAQTGEVVKERRVEDVLSSERGVCDAKPYEGEVELAGEGGRRTVAVKGGKLSFEAPSAAAFESISLPDGEPVPLSSGSDWKLSAWFACAEVLPSPPHEALAALPSEALRVARRKLRLCGELEEKAAGEALSAVEATLAGRSEAVPEEDAAAPEPSAPPEAAEVGPRIETFDEAVMVYRPRLFFVPGSFDVPRLAKPQTFEGELAIVAGVLERKVSDEVILLEVDGHAVLLFLPGAARMTASVQEGQRIEALARAVGSQRLGDGDLPLFKGLWVRNAL